jgi:hypothetical protein
MNFIPSALAFLFGAEKAHAQFVDSIVNIVGSVLPNVSGASNPGGSGGMAIALLLLKEFRPVMVVAAVVLLIILGIRMIVSQDDEILDKSKGMITAMLTGIVMMFLVEPFVAAFYGVKGEVPLSPATGVQIINREVTGVINWALTFAAILAVAMIIFTAFKALVNAHKEDGIAEIRKTIFAIAVGIILIIFRELITVAVGGTLKPSPIPLIGVLVSIVNFVLSFMAFVAVLIIIYAGITMVLNFGNEERAKSARGLIVRAVVGLLVIAVSWALVNFVIASAIGA